jgi:hypothetical protein
MMKQIKFECTFLSEVILNQSSATMQSTENLDYIPGSKFLGIVANKMGNYPAWGNSVRFGDAHLAHGAHYSLKIPYCVFEPKGKEGTEYWIQHLNTPEKLNSLRTEQNIQLKQVRKGYFVNNLDEKSNFLQMPHKTFSLKSAYDQHLRRSKDEQMYGYTALEKGSKWYFSVWFKEGELEEDKLKENLISALEGRHNLGKSRSAQYGRVEIKKVNFQMDYPSGSAEKVENTEYQTIYFLSNACFFTQDGLPTANPTAQQLGIDGTICYEHSQIRTRLYAPYNGTRKTRDTDRFIVEKGSVIVFTSETSYTEGGVSWVESAFLNEGFGQVLYNPAFLAASTWTPNGEAAEKNSKISVFNPPIAGISISEKLLDIRAKVVQKDDPMLKRAKDFIKAHTSKMDKLTNSQWGQVRTLAKKSSNLGTLQTLLFMEHIGFLVTAKRAPLWATIKDELEKELKDLQKEATKNPAKTLRECKDFLIHLANLMQKNNQVAND